MMETTGPRIMIVSDCGWDRPFLVPTDEELHKICVAWIRKFLNRGSFDFPEKDPMEEDLGMSPEEIQKLPEGRAKNMLQKSYNEIQRREERRHEAMILKREVEICELPQ